MAEAFRHPPRTCYQERNFMLLEVLAQKCGFLKKKSCTSKKKCVPFKKKKTGMKFKKEKTFFSKKKKKIFNLLQKKKMLLEVKFFSLFKVPV